MKELIYLLESYAKHCENMSTGFEKIGRDSQLQDHWIRRLVAFIIDSVIVGVCTFILGAIISIPFTLTGIPWFMFNLFSFPFFTGILSVLYFTFLEMYYGSTFGKKIMGLQTEGLNGQRPPLNSTFIRNVSKIYWLLVLIDTLVGLATAGDPRQKMTDRFARTTVVSTAASPFAGVAAPQPERWLCPYCKQKVTEEAKYCPHCGKELA